MENEHDSGATATSPVDERRDHPADEPGEQHRDDGPRPPRYHPPRQDGFDWRGWSLVGVIIFSFLVVPGTILYIPYSQVFLEATGLTWRQAYLTLPMIPALLLGATAVWSAVRSRSPDE